MCTWNGKKRDLYGRIAGERELPPSKKDTVKDTKHIIKTCLVIALMIFALMAQLVIREMPLGFEFDESQAFGRLLTLTLSPMIVIALLAAFFSDNGHARQVGTCGIILLLASAIVITGCLGWMDTFDETGKLARIRLNGFDLRLPVAMMICALSFMKGSAIACLISILQSTRDSGSSEKETGYWASSAFIASMLPLGLILAECGWTWRLASFAGFLFIFSLLPALLYFVKSNKIKTNDVKLNLETAKRDSFMSVGIFVASAATYASFWVFVINYWNRNHHFFDYGPHHVIFLSISTLALALGILFLGRIKRSRKNGAHKMLIGAIMLLVGFPMAAFFGNENLDIVPQALIGIGMALIFYHSLNNVIKIPVKNNAMAWVGIVAAIVILCQAMLIIFDKIEIIFKTTYVPIFVIYPLIALTLILFIYCGLMRREEP